MLLMSCHNPFCPILSCIRFFLRKIGSASRPPFQGAFCCPLPRPEGLGYCLLPFQGVFRWASDPQAGRRPPRIAAWTTTSHPNFWFSVVFIREAEPEEPVEVASRFRTICPNCPWLRSKSDRLLRENLSRLRFAEPCAMRCLCSSH
jgi:hypothetical protein